jgi:hypothetical protein
MSRIYSQDFRAPFPAIYAAMTSSPESFIASLQIAAPIHHKAVMLVEA